MSTGANISVFGSHNGNHETFYVGLHSHSDGYLEGVGRKLYAFMDGMTIVNGLSSGDEKVANGAGCFAALMISNLKGDKPGTFYIEPFAQELCYGVFNYVILIDEKSKTINVKVYDEDLNLIFSGNVKEFGDFVC